MNYDALRAKGDAHEARMGKRRTAHTLLRLLRCPVNLDLRLRVLLRPSFANSLVGSKASHLE